MSWNDDDEDEPLSSRKALERSDHGKKERDDAKASKKLSEHKSLQKLKREMFQKNVHGSVMLHKDTSTPKTFGPKSVEEKAAEQYQSGADESAKMEQMMDAAVQAEQDKQEAKQEEQTGSPD